jgi:hypothetical protein
MSDKEWAKPRFAFPLSSGSDLSCHYAACLELSDLNEKAEKVLGLCPIRAGGSGHALPGYLEPAASWVNPAFFAIYSRNPLELTNSRATSSITTHMS